MCPPPPPHTHTHTLSTPLTLLTDIMLVVRVPVLSEQITEVQPSVSTEGRLRTMAFLRAMRRVPSRVFGEGGNDCMAVVTPSTTKTCKVPLFKEPSLGPKLGYEAACTKKTHSYRKFGNTLHHALNVNKKTLGLIVVSFPGPHQAVCDSLGMRLV